jgi:MscS family membrane protein
VVLNITRKNREWRFYEFIGLRLEDLPKASAVVSDVRKILRQVGAHAHTHRVFVSRGWLRG